MTPVFETELQQTLFIMKKNIFFAAVCVLAAACSTDDGPVISGLTISPESATVFTDEELPQLALSATPADALEGQTVTWSSSDPSIITVSDGGVLAFAVKDIEDASKTVTITASVGSSSAASVITVRGQIARYEIIDFTSDLGFSMLDRNVGATSAEDPGLYFQWGKNEPVTPATIDAEWSAEGAEFADWTVAGNSPCPMGWEPMNTAQKNSMNDNVTDIIFDYEMCLEMGMPEFSNYSEEEYNAAKALWDKMKFVGGGCIRPGATGMVDENGFYNSSAVYVWTGSLVENAESGKSAYTIEFSNYPNVAEGSVTYAYNLRCVKSAE